MLSADKPGGLEMLDLFGLSVGVRLTADPIDVESEARRMFNQPSEFRR
jgi:hypothetical protein